MSNISIPFNHVGKLYQLGVVGTGTLSHHLNRWWATLGMHKEVPCLYRRKAPATSSGLCFLILAKDISKDISIDTSCAIHRMDSSGKIL